MTDAANPPIPYALGRRMTVARMHEALELLAMNERAKIDGDALRKASAVLRPYENPEEERRQVILSGREALSGDPSFGNLHDVADAVISVADGARDPELLKALVRSLGSIRRQLAEDMARDVPIDERPDIR